MSDLHDERNDEKPTAESVAPLKPDFPSARRRLLKKGIGVAPIVLTLASRPVLAWHCKTPSAWGSEQLDANTSLRTNEGHNSWADETWTIQNWKGNSSRGFGQPWTTLSNSFPKIKPNSGTFDYKKVTVEKLFQAGIPGLKQPGAWGGEAKVVSLLGDTFETYIFVAQLNFLLLSPKSWNKLENCLSAADLQEMASGFYSHPNLGTPWGPTEIKNYLYENWIVRP